ncbi:MAG: formate/nitrite transporter family protein, partial [Piscinibacter sp.]|nr:formate/nitrite transporter family protein [Piscinibacter sp.]
MYTHTIDHFIHAAESKITQLRENPWGFMAGSLAGGAYVGLGIVLIFSVGAHLPPAVQKLGMGLTFALALILVVIAGAELFTGYAMYMMLARLAGRVSRRDALRTMAACWFGNLAGSALVAALFALGGANGLLDDPHSLVLKVADAKMSAGPVALLARAVLCNWLVCLALWMAGRVDSDIARCVVIFWCLLAFIASGFEHSVANMTLLSLAAIGHHGDPGTIAAALYNLAMVTTGNLLGGGALVAGIYWLADGTRR